MVPKRPLFEAYWVERDVADRFGGRRVEFGRIPETFPVDVVKIAPVTVPPLERSVGLNRPSPEEIARVRAAGVRVQLSLGGVEHSRGWNTIADPGAFAAEVKALVDRLGCDGVDIDNEEEGVPDERFDAVVAALRAELGDEALITTVSYEPWRDLPWLGRTGHLLDWVSTMAYWDGTEAQIGLWREYAELLGPSNVLVGVACPGCAARDAHTEIETVRELAGWIAREGEAAAGGMMLWCLSAGPMTELYHDAVSQGLRGWTPPAPALPARG